MNRNTIGSYGLYMNRDIGQDAETSNTNLNKNFGADAAGFTLDYFLGDYAAVNSATAFEANKSLTVYSSAIKQQYNGNIAGMVTALTKSDQTSAEVQGRAFTYDELYRIKQSLAFHMDGTALSANAWQSSYSQDNRYREDFSYDWNGNIMSVDRYAGNLSGGTAVKEDALTYHYASESNLLTYIDDAQSACSYDDDLDDQSSGNYDYNAIGQMDADVSERITGIDWNPYGKVKAVHKDHANNTNSCTSTEYGDADVEYLYTASQQRLCKIVKPHLAAGAGISDQDQWEYTWYSYDAGGQLMAVYKQTFDTRSLSAGNYHVNFDVEEHDVYGSGRLGIRKGDDDGKYQMTFAGTKTSGVFSALTYSGASASLSRTHFFREIGNKVYEIANHLGNVLVTVSDKRLGYKATPSSPSTVDRYIADVLSYTDYYSFGAPETGRSGGDSYRYGMNGMEQDADVKGEKMHYTTEFRQYDPRVGRWLSKDPVVKSWESPYAGFANNPTVFSDPSGLDPGNPHKNDHLVDDGPSTRSENEHTYHWEHNVTDGESPSSIATERGLTLDQLATMNPNIFHGYDPQHPDPHYWDSGNNKNYMLYTGDKLRTSGDFTSGAYHVDVTDPGPPPIRRIVYMNGGSYDIDEANRHLKEFEMMMNEASARAHSEIYYDWRTGKTIYQSGVGALQPVYPELLITPALQGMILEGATINEAAASDVAFWNAKADLLTDCSEYASLFYNNYEGGTVINITSATGYWMNGIEYGESTIFTYHEVFEMNGYIYDPMFSNVPVKSNLFFQQYELMNPQGLKIINVK